jgi:hypothetical protein
VRGGEDFLFLGGGVAEFFEKLDAFGDGELGFLRSVFCPLGGLVEGVADLAQRRVFERLDHGGLADEAEVEASHALFIAALQAYRAPATGNTPTSLGNTCQAVSEFVRGTRTAYPAAGTVVG